MTVKQLYKGKSGNYTLRLINSDETSEAFDETTESGKSVLNIIVGKFKIPPGLVS